MAVAYQPTKKRGWGSAMMIVNHGIVTKALNPVIKSCSATGFP